MYEDINEAIRDRLKSPVLGTFLLTFAASNWKFFVVLFGEYKDVDTKIVEAQKYFNWCSILWAFLMVCFVTFFLPYLNKLVTIHRKTVELETNEVVIDNELNALKSRVESLDSLIRVFDVAANIHNMTKELNKAGLSRVHGDWEQLHLIIEKQDNVLSESLKIIDDASKSNVKFLTELYKLRERLQKKNVELHK